MQAEHSNFSLLNYNTFGIDVKADRFFCFTDEQQLIKFLQTQNKAKQEIFVLGGGSNILFTGHFNGLIIHPQNKGIHIINQTKNKVLVKVAAGEIWDNFVAWAVNNNLFGTENLSLIPGSVGAAPIQNIGAYGMEVCNCIEKVKAVEIASGNVVFFSNNDCRFGYRSSIFKRKEAGRYIITEVYFNLTKNGSLNLSYGTIKDTLPKDSEINIKILRQAIISIRNSKLPDPEKIGNAGSFFKNPEVSVDQARQLKEQCEDLPTFRAGDKIKLAAGWLIDQCGWKGKRIGDAGVYDKQALVLVNYGKATGTEIARLSKDIRNDVYKKFGISLEPEVNIL